MDRLNIQPYWNVLTIEAQALYERLARLPFISEFYLAGGTGLALQLGHRLSVDFDLFGDSRESVGQDQRQIILENLSDDPSLKIVWDKDGTFSAHWRGVGISFFRLNRHPLALPPLQIAGIRVAVVEEIGAMKLAAIISRGAKKDYIDLYFILQHTSLERLFEISAIKYPYNPSFPVMAVRALAFFEDAEADPMPQMIVSVDWQKIKAILEKQALDMGRRQTELEKLWDQR